MELTPEQKERAGEHFDPERILEARRRTLAAVEEIGRRIRPGMLEEEGLEIANRTLKELGAEKRWHRSWVRFGVNTIHPYGVPSQPGVRLGENDLFFVDIGPVWDGYEGDGGKTFLVGEDSEKARCIRDGREIYALVRDKWFAEGWTGERLYEFASQEAARRGWQFQWKEANGHRLSDFPHALYYKGNIAELDFRPSPCRWVLEIQIRHPDNTFGAFHEDLLV